MVIFFLKFRNTTEYKHFLKIRFWRFLHLSQNPKGRMILVGCILASAQNSKHSDWGTEFFNICHFAIFESVFLHKVLRIIHWKKFIHFSLLQYTLNTVVLYSKHFFRNPAYCTFLAEMQFNQFKRMHVYWKFFFQY